MSKFTKLAAVGLSFVAISSNWISASNSIFALTVSLVGFSLLFVQIWKTPSLLLPFLFLLSFVVYLTPFVLFSIPFSPYPRFQSQQLVSAFLNQITLFCCVFTFSYSKHEAPKHLFLTEKFGTVRNISVPLIGLVMLAVACGFKGQNVFLEENSYKSYIENLGVESGLPEYLVLLFFVVGFFVRTWNDRVLFVIASIVLAAKLVLLGYRAPLVMLGMVNYLMFLERRMNSIRVLLLAMSGGLLFISLGVIKERAFRLSLFEMLFSGAGEIVISHQTAVDYSSVSVIGLIDSGVWSMSDRLAGLFGFLVNGFIPSSLSVSWFPSARISSFVQNYTPTSGGALVVTHFYFVAGIVGVCALGWGLGRIFSSVGKGGRMGFLFSIAGPACFVFFPRWISYDPGNFLLRFPIWAILGVALVRTFLRKDVTSGTIGCGCGES